MVYVFFSANVYQAFIIKGFPIFEPSKKIKKKSLLGEQVLLRDVKAM